MIQIYRYVVTNDGIPFRPEDWARLKKIAEGNPDESKIGELSRLRRRLDVQLTVKVLLESVSTHSGAVVVSYWYLYREAESN